MSFGWSAGDIVSVVSTLVKVGKALKEPGGAAAEYQDTVDFLEGVGKTLMGIRKILQNNPEQAESLKAPSKTSRRR